MSKPFKRYFTKPEHIENGKGSWRRETQVSEQELGDNWCRNFGHKVRHGFCVNCGIPSQEIVAEQS